MKNLYLLTNALKFSYSIPRIEVSLIEKDKSVVISIKNGGVGMSEDLRRNHFDSRKATSRKGSKGETGTGFGMPLVKEFVAKYGGTIEVNSRDIDCFPDGHGMEFLISLKKAA